MCAVKTAEVTTATRQYKTEENPPALLIVSYLADVVLNAHTEGNDDDSEDHETWADDSVENASDIRLINMEDAVYLKRSLANSKILHGKSSSADMDSALFVMNQ